MSELTTEDLQAMKEFCGKSHLPILKELAVQAFDELLSLRTAAAPGDEEVERLAVQMEAAFVAQNDTDLLTHEERIDAQASVIDFARQIQSVAIARGRTRTDAVNRAAEWANESERLEQQLRERDAENTSLEQRISRLSVEYEDLGKRFDEQASQIATLTAERDELKSGNDFLRQEIEDWKEANRRAEAERDEARKEVERLRMAVGCATTIKGDMVMRADDPLGMMQEVCAYVKSLRSCPEMGEVDAIEDWLEGKEIEFGVVRRIKRLVEMVGQLSAALTEERNARVLAQKQRDEIILDLNTVDRVDYLGELRHMAAYTGSEPSDAIFAARRILAICGKEAW